MRVLLLAGTGSTLAVAEALRAVGCPRSGGANFIGQCRPRLGGAIYSLRACFQHRRYDCFRPCLISIGEKR
jgi:hypothetical protein